MKSIQVFRLTAKRLLLAVGILTTHLSLSGSDLGQVPSRLSLAPAAPSVKGMDLSRAPSEEQLMAAGQLGGMLFPTHALKDKQREESARWSFGRAMEEWNQHHYPEAVRMLRQHLKDFPDSPWAAEADLHIGCDASYNGRYSEAEVIFTRLIATHQGKDHPGAKMLVNKAHQRLALQFVEHNELEAATAEFKTLLQESPDWRHRTYASHWIQKLSRFAAAKEALATCGADALAYVLEKAGRPAAAAAVRTRRPATMRGHSLAALARMSGEQGLELTALEISPADLERLPLPAIVQVPRSDPRQSGHYWILERVKGENLELYDPQAVRRLSQTRAELAREWSSRVLVFAKTGPLPGRRLLLEEMEASAGGCCGVPHKEDDLGDPPPDRPPPDEPKQDTCSQGYPRWVVNVVNMNLFVTDTPLWYDPPYGPPVRITLSYNSQSAIAQHEPFGNKWQFNYGSYLVVDTAGTVVVFMPDGRRDAYTPNGSGGYSRPFRVFNTLTRIEPNHFELRFPDDSVYVYQIPPGTDSQQPFLTEIRDSYGQKLTFAYDSNVQLTTITDAQGLATTLVYDSNGLVTTVTDPFGRSAAFEYSSDRNLVHAKDMGNYQYGFSYDSSVYLTGIIDQRGTWAFRTEPADGINNGSNAYPPPGGVMWANYRITVTDPLGHPCEYYYNGYSSYGWYVSPRDYVGWRSKYDNNFNQTVAKTLYYFEQMNSSRQGEISQVVRPDGGAMDYTFDATTGNRVEVSDAHGDTWHYTYNGMGSVTSVRDPKDTVKSFAYAANGIDLVRVSGPLGQINVTWNAQHRVTAITDWLNHTTTFAYNPFGQLLTEADPLQITNSYIYDAGHRLYRVERAGQAIESLTYDAIGRVLTHADDTGLILTNEYNNLNQLTRVTYPDGRSDTYTYSTCCPRLLDSATDRAGRTTLFVYDALKRLVQRVNPDGAATRSEYDANGNLIRLADPNGNATTFAYDTNNRLIRKTYANGKSMSFRYDEAGLLVARTNARGTAITCTYDQNHNRTSIVYSDGTPAVTNVFDSSGRIVRVTDGLGTTVYIYDANSRPVSLSGPWVSSTVSYVYDAAGRAVRIAGELGQSVNYLYDDLDRLAEVQTAAGSYAYAYTGASPLENRLSRPNGSYTSYSYDALNRLALVSNHKATGELISQFAYHYSPQDLIDAETVNNAPTPVFAQGESQTYNYNSLNQLVGVQPGAPGLAYDDDGNLVRGYTPEGFAFVAAYDAEDHLVSLSYTNASSVAFRVECAYRADGQLARLKRFTDNVLTEDTLLLGDQFFSVQDRDGRDNSILREYAWGLGRAGGGIGGLLDLKAGANRYAYIYDGKGNVSAVLGSDQSSAAAYAYEPFGEPWPATGPLNQPMRFSTKRYDETTGLAYFGYRFYAPRLGIWLTRDPLPQMDNLLLYRFNGDNPVQRVDPFGLQSDPSKWTDPYSKNDDYCKTLDVSKKTTPQVQEQGNALKRLWDKVTKALGGSENTTPPPPSGNQGRRQLSNFPNQNP